LAVCSTLRRAGLRANRDGDNIARRWQHLVPHGGIIYRGISNQGGIMKRLPFLGIAVMAGLCIGTATSQASITQDDLGPVPDAGQITYQTTYVAMSPDCHEIALVIKADNRVQLRINGKADRTVDEIASLLYSPDSAHLAYLARKDKIWSIVLDGKESSLTAPPPSQLVFSGDGNHLMYITTTAAGQALVVDGAIQKIYSQAAQLAVGPAGFHYAYAVFGDNDQWEVVHDGVETEHGYSSIKQIRLSYDGQHVAFIGCRVKGDYMVERDGAVYGPYYEVSSPPALTPDGKHLTFGAYQLPPGAPLDVRGFPELDAYRVVDGNATSAPMGPTTLILYSLDGKHDLAVGLRPGLGMVRSAGFAIDGQDAGHSGVHADVTLSPDGRRFACAGGAQIVVDENVTADLAGAGPPLFSPDSQHLAYAVAHGTRKDWFAPNKDWYISADGNSLPGGLVIPTADLVNYNDWRPSTDVEDQLSFDNGHSYNGQIPYHFDPDGTLVYFRIEGGHLYRVHWKPDDATTAPTTMP
jgi:hypothetical protein